MNLPPLKFNRITDVNMATTSTSPIHAAQPDGKGVGAKVDAVDLCYSIVVNGKMKRILKNVSFSLVPGNMCALMGPSGAGKR